MASNIKELKAELEAKKAEIEQALAPKRAKADAIRAQMQPLENELRAVNKDIQTVERESGLREISMEIASIARASKNNRTLTNEGAAKPAPAAQ